MCFFHRDYAFKQKFVDFIDRGPERISGRAEGRSLPDIGNTERAHTGSVSIKIAPSSRRSRLRRFFHHQTTRHHL